MIKSNKHDKSAEEGPKKVIAERPAHSLPQHDESNWLISYADMMTLLCGFFIMLFSMAKLDVPKYDAFKSEIARQFGGAYVSPTGELVKETTQVLKELGLETKSIVKSDPYGVSIVFESTIFFNTLSADVTPEGYKILKTLIDSVATRQQSEKKTYRIVVEGHTDSRPITGGIYPSNWELSGARAARVIRMFLDRGFTPDHLTAIGYADTRPHLQARTPSGNWDETALAKNRRVVLRILEPGVDAIPFPDLIPASAKATPSTANAVSKASAPSTASIPNATNTSNTPNTAANTAH